MPSQKEMMTGCPVAMGSISSKIKGFFSEHLNFFPKLADKGSKS